MCPLTAIPAPLRGRAFSRREALAAGLTARMLDHQRFRQVFPSVYRDAQTPLTRAQLIEAARLALPDDARISHVTRFEELGLDVGDPIAHFTVARDHHLAIPGIQLHRTVRMPPGDSRNVCVEAAFVQTATLVPRIELVAIGDWLCRTEQTSRLALTQFACLDDWRPGAIAAARAVGLIDPRAESLPESRVRLVLRMAGLPTPEVNGVVEAEGEFIARGDLVLRNWKLVLEYEGRQHAEDGRQFARDIDRYAALRAAGWSYVQITAARLARPRSLATQVYQELQRLGYEGPPPRFGPEFRELFLAPGWSVR